MGLFVLSAVFFSIGKACRKKGTYGTLVPRSPPKKVAKNNRGWKASPFTSSSQSAPWAELSPPSTAHGPLPFHLTSGLVVRGPCNSCLMCGTPAGACTRQPEGSWENIPSLRLLGSLLRSPSNCRPLPRSGPSSLASARAASSGPRGVFSHPPGALPFTPTTLSPVLPQTLEMCKTQSCGESPVRPMAQFWVPGASTLCLIMCKRCYHGDVGSKASHDDLSAWGPHA